jgi:hypothetical protein
MWANGLDILAGMQVVSQGGNRGPTGKARQSHCRGWRGHINWGGRWRLGKIGSAYAWTQFITIFMQRRHQQAWLGSFEGKVPGPGTIAFAPSLEDTPAARINNSDICLGEPDGTAKNQQMAPSLSGYGGRRASHGPAWLQEGRDGTKASVALVTDFSGRLFATLTPAVGA